MTVLWENALKVNQEAIRQLNYNLTNKELLTNFEPVYQTLQQLQQENATLSLYQIIFA